ncbi:MAG: ACT domain-containing protein [Acidimicrobiia bacterium]|nr:ACT domain-containing protein [Acidimicrobiia bacterium]
MSHYAVSAVGADRPGIVAAVTGVFLEHGCNLEDTSMTILRGHFAMMLVVAAPDGLEQKALEHALGAPASNFELVVAVRAIDDDIPRSPEGDAWTVSVYGADRPGIVHRVASELADNGVNIVDLSTRVIGDAERPVYAMILEVTLPAGADVTTLQSRLAGLAGDLGVECSLHPSEADIL